MTPSFHILTGGTSGMGLEVARSLGQRDTTHVIAGARDPNRAGALRAAVPADRLTVLPLDLASLSSVKGFAAAVITALDGRAARSVICNAGLQLTGPLDLVYPGIERSFLVNVLSHIALVDDLLPHLEPGARVVTVGSGTHNPADKLARMFGFRGAGWTDPERIAAGDIGREGTDQQQSMDRYATSKLGSIYHAMHLATEVSPDRCRVLCFDPGLMPGTALARDRSALERFGWSYALPALRPVLRGVSSGPRSGRALVRLCLDSAAPTTGTYIEFTGDPAPRSDLSRDTAKAAALVTHARALIHAHS